MVDRIGGAVVWLHMWHLESRENWFIQDALRERLDSEEVVVVEGLLTFYLKSDKLTVNLFELAFIVVKPSLLENSRGRTPEELEDGEAEGIRSLFPFLILCAREGEGECHE